MVAIGSGLSAYRNPVVTLQYTQNIDPDYTLKTSEFSIVPGEDGEDDKIIFSLPENIASNVAYSLRIAEKDTGDLWVGSDGEGAYFLVLADEKPNITVADFGQHKDDEMWMTFLDANKGPVQEFRVDPVTGQQTFITARSEIPTRANDEYFYVASRYYDNDVLDPDAHYIRVECRNPGNDSTCTYGISAIGVLLGDGTSNDKFVSSAGKLKKNETKDYCLGDKCELIIF